MTSVKDIRKIKKLQRFNQAHVLNNYSYMIEEQTLEFLKIEREVHEERTCMPIMTVNNIQ